MTIGFTFLGERFFEFGAFAHDVAFVFFPAYVIGCAIYALISARRHVRGRIRGGERVSLVLDDPVNLESARRDHPDRYWADCETCSRVFDQGDGWSQKCDECRTKAETRQQRRYMVAAIGFPAVLFLFMWLARPAPGQCVTNYSPSVPYPEPSGEVCR
jgi:predicted nucleic acid-binding Zn ribbon protein